MSAIIALARATAGAIVRIGDRVTCEPIAPQLGDERRPHLGHVPYFAAKLTVDDKRRLSGSRR